MKVAFKPRIVQGAMGCVAHIDEFRIECGGETQEAALYGLSERISKHVQLVCLSSPQKFSASVRKLAYLVREFGFLLVDIELDHQKLARKLEKMPHVSVTPDGEQYWVVFGGESVDLPCMDEDKCREYGGRCAFKDEIAMLKIMAMTTSLQA